MSILYISLGILICLILKKVYDFMIKPIMLMNRTLNQPGVVLYHKTHYNIITGHLKQMMHSISINRAPYSFLTDFILNDLDPDDEMIVTRFGDFVELMPISPELNQEFIDHLGKEVDKELEGRSILRLMPTAFIWSRSSPTWKKRRHLSAPGLSI